MNPYIEKIKSALSEPDGTVSNTDIRTLLYHCYLELHPVDTDAVQHGFSRLDGILSQLSLRDYDKVWYLVCGLCADHAESAFLEGLRVGIRIITGFSEPQNIQNLREG